MRQYVGKDMTSEKIDEKDTRSVGRAEKWSTNLKSKHEI